MKKDVPTITRYFVLLLIVFALWLYLLHDFSKTDNFKFIFGTEQSSL